MFGYLQVDKNELKLREYEAYRSVYCGLCKRLGREYGLPARLLLSYDCTLYTILLMSLNKSCTGFDSGRCVCNPLKKCRFAKCSDDSYSKAAALTVITAYFKLQDDISDKSFFKSLPARIISPIFSHWRKKAEKRFPELDDAVSRLMEAQREAESDEYATVDSAADPTSKMMSELMGGASENESESRVLAEIGYHLGRWVYLMDAADDLEKDRKSGSFNVFLKYSGDDLSGYVSSVLSTSLGRAFDAYELMTFNDFKGILDNMMRYGFPLKQKSVIANLAEVKDDKSV